MFFSKRQLFIFKTTLLQWLSWWDHEVVHRSTCRHAWHIWGRDGLGSSQSVMWPVSGTCFSHTGNVPVQCCGSMGEFDLALVAGIQAIRALHVLHSTRLSTRLPDSGSIAIHFRQVSWRCHISWARYSEDSVVVGGLYRLYNISSGLNSSNTCTSERSPFSSTTGGTSLNLLVMAGMSFLVFLFLGCWFDFLHCLFFVVFRFLGPRYLGGDQ